MRVASELDTLDGKRTFTQIVPSLSSGKNSEPSREAAKMATANKDSAMATTLLRWVKAQAKMGL